MSHMLSTSHEGGSLQPMSFCDQHGAVLLERLRYQRETGRFCDVVIRVDGRQFAAHRNVLAACSPYLDAIFKVNVVCKEQVTINCKNIGAFEVLLNYMYSGICVIDRSTVAELLSLSNNFLINKVKNYCAEYLDRNMDASNCLSVKRLARKFNLPLLLKASSDFFDLNFNRCLLESVDLLEYNSYKIEALLSDPKYMNQFTSDAHLRLLCRWASSEIQKRSDPLKRLMESVQLTRVAPATIDYVLDYSPIFMKHRSSRIYLLSQIRAAGIELGKYTDEYNRLMCDGNTIDVTVPPLLSSQSAEESDSLMAEDEPGVVGEKTANEILEGTPQPYLIRTEPEPCLPPPMKLKIKLGNGDGLSRNNDKIIKKNDKGIRKKRRRSGIGSDEPGTSKDCNIDEDGIDGVYGLSEEAVLYPDLEGIDPCSIEDDDDEENVTGGQFMCIHCRFATNESEDLQRHMARRHDRNTVYMCTMCDEGFEARWSIPFYHHVQTHFDNTSSLSCDRCAFNTQEGLHTYLSHRLLHSSDRPFKCGVCGWRGSSRSQLWSHNRIHIGRAICSCTLCGRSFKREESLALHSKTHQDKRTHICLDCGWISKTESDLNSHRALSHQVDVYSCHISGCDYVSTKKSQLAAHLRTHLAVRAHMCRICGRGFIEKSHVVRHERIHLTEKPFKCETCDYASSRRDKLKEHILKYHNGTNTSGVVKQVQRRRYKRAKELAQAIANHSQSRGMDVLFRPIESHRDRIEQWHNSINANNISLQIPRALSVAPSISTGIPPTSPGSLSLMNVPLGMNRDNSPMSILSSSKVMNDDVSGVRLHDSPLHTPVPRSPHNHSDPFAMSNIDEEGQRPMSLPPYGGHNWFN